MTIHFARLKPRASAARTAVRLAAALCAAAAVALVGACATRTGRGGVRIALSFPESAGLSAADGRMLLILSTSDSQEPRFQVSDADRTAQIFGVDVDGLKPGAEVTIGDTTL